MGATGWSKPSPRAVWRAILIYLQHAYDGPVEGGAGATLPVPSGTPWAVRARLETLRSTPDAAFYDSAVFEHAAGAPACPPGGAAPPPAPARESRDGPTRYALRLGNRHYPHMKLVID